MKTSIKFFLGAGVAMGLSASGIAQTSTVLDGAYIEEHTQTQRVVPYPHIRQADVMWARRVWREIDLRQKKHRSVGGHKFVEVQSLFPGYVFLRISQGKGINPYECKKIDGVYRLLTQLNDDWQLYGSDEAFAAWVFENDGVIGMSQAISQGSKVKILSGPLKELEGQIVKIDRRGRNGQIEIDFNSRIWRVWLAFEYTDLKIIE